MHETCAEPRIIQSEVDEHLLVDEAFGHFMYTVGNGDDKNLYNDVCMCVCSAYSGKRAHKLTKQFDKKCRCVAHVEKLRQAIHPTKGNKFDRQPRRMTLWTLAGLLLRMLAELMA